MSSDAAPDKSNDAVPTASVMARLQRLDRKTGLEVRKLFVKLTMEKKILEEQVHKYSNETSLALWFTPDAIAEHFVNSETVERLSEGELRVIGNLALQDDRLYATFHDVLRSAVADFTGVDEDSEDLN